MDTSGLLVSICYTAHNNEQLLAKAIEGFMMQKTNFEFDIVVANYCTAGETSPVLEQYQQKHPGKIKVVSSAKTEGSLPGLISCTKMCKGRYIAFCGENVSWADPGELQKQVNFLEANPQYQ